VGPDVIGPPTMRSATAVLVCLVAAAATAVAEAPECSRWRAAFSRMSSTMLTIETGARTLQLAAKLAGDDEQKAAGFQCASRHEIEQTNILFDFGTEITTAFHMQNVVAPLDIAFAKADGRIFSVQTMTPSPTMLYRPLGSFRYALETRAGFFEANGIRAGAARLLPAR
jgi:uncharacterized membrane protein (UPF0127 family)